MDLSRRRPTTLLLALVAVLAALAGLLVVTPASAAEPEITVRAHVVHPVVPVGYAATLRGSVDRPEGWAVQVTLTCRCGGDPRVVARQVLPAGTTAYTFSLPTRRTGQRLYRVSARPSPEQTAQSDPSPWRSETVVAPRIRRVQPSGDEYVVLVNTGTRAIDLYRWRLGTARRVIPLPHRVMAPGSTLRVYTGPGTNTAHRLYASRLGNLWHATGKARLSARDGVLLASRTY